MPAGITQADAQASYRAMIEALGGVYRNEEANDAYNRWKVASDALGNNGVGVAPWSVMLAEAQQVNQIRFQRPTASNSGVGGTADPTQTAPSAYRPAPLPALPPPPPITTLNTPQANDVGHAVTMGPGAINTSAYGTPGGPTGPAGLYSVQGGAAYGGGAIGGTSTTTWLIIGGIAAAGLYLWTHRGRR